METINYKNLDEVTAFNRLLKDFGTNPVVNLKNELNQERVNDFSINAGAGLSYNYAAKLVNADVISALADLASDQQIIAKYKSILSGDRANTGEDRMVLHHLLRGDPGEASYITENGRALRDFYVSQQERVNSFANDVHTGKITGSTGRKFTTAVQIGIGGSDLGPRALYLALSGYASAVGSEKLKAKFISNVDPDDGADILSELDLESTLFILVSKSGTTQETLTNQDLVKGAMKESGIPGLDPAQHMVAVTSQTSPLANSDDFLYAFYIDDYIGGRYSATSPVGGLILTLAFGPDIFQQVLNGAAEADRVALNPVVIQNAALLDALIGIYERNVLGLGVTAILPYSQALIRFPAHLQQLDMESNGKQVNRFGEPISYSTGPIIFGEPGTNGQHSFYQLLHQGTDVVPLQFIGFLESQRKVDIETDGTSSQVKLCANLAAQIVAFAMGKENSSLNKNFPGERPSSLIWGKELTPKSLGALLAHFENKVMFQGFLWNINSFDQEGVQLGKVLTNQLLEKGDKNPVLSAYGKILGVL